MSISIGPLIDFLFEILYNRRQNFVLDQGIGTAMARSNLSQTMQINKVEFAISLTVAFNAQ